MGKLIYRYKNCLSLIESQRQTDRRADMNILSDTSAILPQCPCIVLELSTQSQPRFRLHKNVGKVIYVYRNCLSLKDSHRKTDRRTDMKITSDTSTILPQCPCIVSELSTQSLLRFRLHKNVGDRCRQTDRQTDRRTDRPEYNSPPLRACARRGTNKFDVVENEGRHKEMRMVVVTMTTLQQFKRIRPIKVLKHL